jgi:hypothetical protein
LLLLSVPLLASPLSAQDARIAVGPFGAHRWASSLYEHDVRYVFETPYDQEASLRHQERLRVGSSSLAGARLEYRVRPAWRVYVEGAYGRASYEFYEGTLPGTPTNRGSSYERWVRGDATIMSLAMGVARQLQLRAGGPAIEMSVGGALDQTRLDKHVCPPPRPSGGIILPCFLRDGAYPRVEPRYEVPSVTGGLAVHQRVHRRVEIRTGARYAYGRADTRSMARDDLAPGVLYHAPPASHWFRVLQLSAGATMTF